MVGRLRVQIASATGQTEPRSNDAAPQFLNPSIRSLHDLLRAMGRHLPQTVGRIAPQAASSAAAKPPSVGSQVASVSEASGVTLVPRKKAKSRKK